MHNGHESEFDNAMFNYNIGFLRSLIPILRRDLLQSFGIKFDAPKCNHASEDHTESRSVWSAFFESVLSSENLRSITLDADAGIVREEDGGYEHVSGPMIEAMGRIHDKGCRLSQLRCLDITVYPHGASLAEGLDDNLFKFISACCSSLKSIRLCLYEPFWNYGFNVEKVKDFLTACVNLSSLEINFSHCNQQINRTLLMIYNFVKERSPKKTTYVSLVNMSFVKARTLSKFADMMADEGLALNGNTTTLLDFDADSDEEGDLIGDIEKYGNRPGGEVLVAAISFGKQFDWLKVEDESEL